MKVSIKHQGFYITELKTQMCIFSIHRIFHAWFGLTILLLQQQIGSMIYFYLIKLVTHELLTGMNQFIN